MARRRTLITYAIIYFLTISTAIRGLVHFQNRTYQWVVTGLLAVFLLLLVIEPWLFRHSPWNMHLYLAVQTVITAALLTIPSGSNDIDYFAVLFIPLTVQAMWVLPLKTGYHWIIVFTAVMVIMMVYQFGWIRGLPYILTYLVAHQKSFGA